MKEVCASLPSQDAELQLHHFDAYYGGLEDAAAAGAVVSVAVLLKADEVESHLSQTIFQGLAEELEQPDDVGRVLPAERLFLIYYVVVVSVTAIPGCSSSLTRHTLAHVGS